MSDSHPQTSGPRPSLAAILNTAIRRPETLRKGWLVLILLLLALFKVPLTAQTRDTGVDGGYYTNVAQHVRDGNGLQTNISLYHKAYSYFPHPTSIYPAWPVLYGYVAKAFPLLEVGRWLPTCLYFITLILGYLWARRLFPAPLFPADLPGFDAGHLFVLCLGMQAHFFRYTSVPFAEGLAYAALMAGLWRGQKALGSPNLQRGLELGLWLAVAMLALSQLAIAGIAAFAALMWATLASPPRRRYAAALAGFTVGYVALVGVHYFRIAQFVEEPRLWSLLRFDWNRESSSLSYVQMIKDYGTAWDFVESRLEGLPLAFAPMGKHAYASGFYSIQYAPLVVLPILLAAAWRAGKAGVRRAWRWLRASGNQYWIFAVLLALLGFVSLHAIRKVYAAEWNFSHRQALTCLFLFFLSLVYLLRTTRVWAKTIGVILMCGYLYLGARTISGMEPEGSKQPSSAQRSREALAKWLIKTRAERDGLTVIMPAGETQRMAAKTPGVNYHWIYRRTTLDDLAVMANSLGADYLVLAATTKRWKLKLSTHHDDVTFRLVKRIEGAAIYRINRSNKVDETDGFSSLAVQRRAGPL